MTNAKPQGAPSLSAEYLAAEHPAAEYLAAEQLVLSPGDPGAAKRTVMLRGPIGGRLAACCLLVGGCSILGGCSGAGGGTGADDRVEETSENAGDASIWPDSQPVIEADDASANPWLEEPAWIADGIYPFDPPPSMPGAGGAGGAFGGELPGPLDEGDQETAGPGAGGSPPVSLPLLERRFDLYLEGEGSDKRLDIWGEPGTSPTPCRVEVFTNGAFQPRRSILLVDVFPEDGFVRLCSDAAWVEGCTEEMSGSLFNGNDALVLSCGNQVMDSLGTVGEDPGRAWSEDGVSTENQTLLRCTDRVDRDPSDETVLTSNWVTWSPDETEEEARIACETAPPSMGGATGYL